MMSFNVFVTVCILGLDFMIYVLFKLIYGDRRSLIARRVAEQRKAAQAEASGLFLVPAKKTPPSDREPDHSAASRVSSTDSRKLFARNSYTTRIA
jgi:hypothetical protein